MWSLPGSLWTRERNKERKKKLLRGNSSSSSGKETSASRGSCLLWPSIQCCTWKTFLFPGSFGKWRNTIAVKYKLESVMNTSGCKFQNYLVSLLASSRGRKPYRFGVISKSPRLLGSDQTEESELVGGPTQKSPEIFTFISGWKRCIIRHYFTVRATLRKAENIFSSHKYRQGKQKSELTVSRTSSSLTRRAGARPPKPL